MGRILCPNCGGESLFHYTDAYVLRTPVGDGDGKLRLMYEQTTEFDENFFQCATCGHRPEKDELAQRANGGDASD
jgi:hypothetical protein